MIVSYIDSEFLTESMRNGSKVANKLNGVTYNIIRLEFVRLTLGTFWTESFAVYKCPVGVLMSLINT
jgi:hypothetical protein